MMTTLYNTRVQVPAAAPALAALYDGVSSNPPGRDISDVAVHVGANINTPNPTGILRPKKSLLMSTFNVRTLSNVNKIYELIAHAESHNMDILSIQEHRHFHEDIDIKYSDYGRWTLITSSATKNSINATVGGVGFLISPKAKASLNFVSKISSRIITATFNSNPILTAVSCYSPTNCADVADVENFYDELSDFLDKVPKHNFLMLGGDYNAQLGGQNHPLSYHQQNNRNGAFLESVMTQFNLIATNTRFQKRRGKLWTINYGNGSKGQIDYILVNRKWLNSVMNSEAYSSFESINSDHRIVTARVRLSVRANKPKKRTNMLRWDTLSSDDTVHSQFSVAVKNKYQALCSEVNLDEPPTNTQCYSSMVQACKEAAEETIPKRQVVRTRLPWEDEEISDCRVRVGHLSSKKRATKKPEDIALFKEAVSDLEALYLQKQAEYVEVKTAEIESAHEHCKSKLVWKIVNEVTKRKKKDSGRLNASSPKERIALWKNHFSSLLGTAPLPSESPIETIVHHELNIDCDNFTLDELDTCLKSMKNGKAAGLDDIPAEVWKSRILDAELLDFCNRTLNGDKPEFWSTSGIVPVPKKGDLSNPTNYRGISLTPIAAKIYNKMILNRMRPYIDPILRPNQNGFRKGRGTISQILTIRRIIEGVKAKNLKAILTFIDFKKAFDSVDRSKLMTILSAYGIPEKIVRAIAIMYTDTMAKVLSPDGETDFFEILAGVLQGDTLAPFLFVIVIDYVLRTAVEGYEHLGLTLSEGRSARLPRKANKAAHPSKSISDTGYADDLCMLSNTLEQAQELLDRVETAAAEVGLLINEKKTEYMSFSQPQAGGTLASKTGKDLKKVDDFLYLGSWVNTTERDLSVRIAKAWAASNKLDTIWKSTLSRKLKVQFFRATVESVLLYGAECWTLTKQQQKRLDGCYTRLLRASLNVSWKQKLTNKVLYGDISPVSHTVKERRLRFAGHCFRAKNECISDVLLWKPQQGKRRVGRPAKTFTDLLEEDTGYTTVELEALMADRVVWRDVVRNRPLMSP